MPLATRLLNIIRLSSSRRVPDMPQEAMAALGSMSFPPLTGKERHRANPTSLHAWRRGTALVFAARSRRDRSWGP